MDILEKRTIAVVMGMFNSWTTGTVQQEITWNPLKTLCSKAETETGFRPATCFHPFYLLVKSMLSLMLLKTHSFKHFKAA